MNSDMNLADALNGSWPDSSKPKNPPWPGTAQNHPPWPQGGNGGGPGGWPPAAGGPDWPSAPGGFPQPAGPPGDGFPQPGGGFPQPGGGFPQPGGGFPQPGGGFPLPAGPSGDGFPLPAGPAVQPRKPLGVPHSHPFPGGLHDKLLITIRGTVNHNPNKFTVDLHTDRDLAFHFNPRFNENGHKVIVRNSCIGKKWGQEERQLSNFPFAPGKSFEMKILCTHQEFKVAVNNSHQLEFKHRITNLRSITRLCIHGDISLQGFNVENLP